MANHICGTARIDGLAVGINPPNSAENRKDSLRRNAMGGVIYSEFCRQIESFDSL